MANGAWRDQSRRDTLERSKANFNPEEPRDDRNKEWTKLGDGPDDARLENIQYRGHFRNVVVDSTLKTLKAQGDRVLKSPRIIDIDGIRTIPDGIAIGISLK